MDQIIKEKIDNMQYSEMLAKWRFAKVGDSMFQGETGNYFAKVMGEKKNALPIEVQVGTSKALGW
jgi:hypothetical protein